MAFTVRATAIVPKGFKPQKVQLFVKQALHEEGKRDQKELAKTTNGWSSAPHIRYNTSLKAKEASVWIGPSGSPELVEKWRRIDEGTRKHDISARRVPRLVFPYQGKGRSHNPKTRQLWIGSVAGAGQKFGPIIRPKSVLHPGIAPRYWSKTMAAQRIGPFARNIQAAINRGMAP